jgi:lysophospholipase L1-like esterase
MNMEHYEHEVRELEARLRTNVSALPPVVFYGSSSIRLWDSLAADFPDAPVVNCGFGGSTLEACAWFFARLVLPLSPAALVLYAGDNDLGDGREPGFVAEQLTHLLRQLDAHDEAVPVAILSIKPSPARWALRDRIVEANASFRSSASQRAHTHYVDVFTPMLHDGAPRNELFLEDGLHMDRAGYALWREVLQQERTEVF